MHNKKLYGIATVGTKGQIVIPADAREELGISSGDRLYVIGSPEAKIIGLLNEEAFETIMQTLVTQVETFRAFTDKKDKDNS